MTKLAELADRAVLSRKARVFAALRSIMPVRKRAPAAVEPGRQPAKQHSDALRVWGLTTSSAFPDDSPERDSAMTADPQGVWDGAISRTFRN